MSEKSRKIVEWAVDAIEGHPRNRPVNGKSPRYAEIRDSIKDNGIQQPLIVRDLPGLKGRVQLLCGHHRLAAAKEIGMQTVPVDNRGVISDAQAFDIMAISNLHIPLTPLEEGQRAADWLDAYNQDAQAVAAKLGQTPRWVVEHAQIYRGLTADWHKAAAEIPAFDRWTSSHWAVIAKLPARIQAEQLSKFRNGAFCSYDRWTVKELERRIDHQTFRLAKAPFPRQSCTACPNRTGQQPLFLYADTADGATGDNELCLDRKCWQRKCEKAEREAFKQTAAQKGLENAVPLSLLVGPKSSWDRGYDEYRKKLSACKRAHKGLVTADQVKIVKETTPGAVPAIVVAGVGKGTTKWVKVKPTGEDDSRPSKPRPPSAKDIERDQEFARWDRVCQAAVEKIRHSPAPDPEILLILLAFIDWPDPDYERAEGRILRAWDEDLDAFRESVRDLFWKAITDDFMGLCFIKDNRESLRAIGPFFRIDIEADYQALAAADAKEEALREKTEIVPVELPKSLKAKCELRLLEDSGKWFGGYAIDIPKDQVDLPVDTLGESYETKAHAVKAMAEAAAEWLAERVREKKCPKTLSNPMATAITQVIDACELELQRSGQGPTPADCTGNCAGCSQSSSCNGAQLPGPGVPTKPRGLIEDFEQIDVPLEKAWKASVTIKIGQVGDRWYGGYNAHVPGAGDSLACTTENESHESRVQAIAATAARVVAWLAGKPGKRGYKHHQDIILKLGEQAGEQMRAARDGGKAPVMRCTFPLPAREPIEEPAGEVRKCRVCGRVGGEDCTHCAGTVCPVCGWEEADLCANCAAQGKTEGGTPTGRKGKMPSPREEGPRLNSAKSIASGKITAGLEPRCDAVRTLHVNLPKGYDSEVRLLAMRDGHGAWHAGAYIRVGQEMADMPPHVADDNLPGKADCLREGLQQISDWLEVKSTVINKRLRTQIASRVEEAIEEELAKRTCRVCGCTQDDCQACIEATGTPCHWVEEDLCSRCQGGV